MACKECGGDLPPNRTVYCSSQCSKTFLNRKNLADYHVNKKKANDSIRKNFKPYKFPRTNTNKQKSIVFALMDMSQNDRIGFSVSLSAINIYPIKVEIKKPRNGFAYLWTYKCNAWTMNQIEDAVKHYDEKWIDTCKLEYRRARDKYVKLWIKMDKYLKENKK